MSDDKELIEEALSTGTFDAGSDYASANYWQSLARRLADALEAKTGVRVDLDSAEALALAELAYPDSEFTHPATNLAFREAFLRGFQAHASESAARQSSTIDRDVAIDAIAGGTISVPGGYGVLHGDDAANIVDAIIGQAAVPDAATELAQLRAERDAGKQTEADRAYLYQLGLKLGAERDAALAAVERVAALHHKKTEVGVDGDCATESCDHEDECPTKEFEVCARCWDMCEEVDPYFGERGIAPVLWPCPTVAALDGAPEPEDVWEWGYRGETLIDVHTRKSRESAEGAVKDLTEYWALHGKKFEVVRRRPAGPWISVEVEKP